MILGLEYCHSNSIIHRDIKPENLVLDNKGYVKVTDFGIAKLFQKDNAHETSGTPGYMAPEVMCSQNHTLAVDYFALGVIGYEFMNGTRPYVGKTRKEIKEKLMANQAQIKKTEIPKNWSVESADCINRLLQRKPGNRLGLRGAAEVKEHSWFKYYSWKDLYLGRIDSPFIPPLGDNYDHKYCSKQENLGLSTQERYIGIIGSSVYHRSFKDFQYFNRRVHEKLTQNQIGTSKDFVNPHLVYFEEITGNDNNENDASIINRNILSKIPAQENVYSDIKKFTGQAQPSLFKMYTSYKKLNRSINLNLSKGNSNSSFRNIDNSMSSIYTAKKHSYYKGNSYNF